MLYTAELADTAMEYGVTLHAFVDDTQLYLHCDRNSIVQHVTTLEQCVAAIGKWMSANRLKLDADKTELLWTGSRHSLRGLSGNGPSLVLDADVRRVFLEFGLHQIYASVSSCLWSVEH